MSSFSLRSSGLANVKMLRTSSSSKSVCVCGFLPTHPAASFQIKIKSLCLWFPTYPPSEVGALRHFLSDFRQDCHPSWWKFRWIAWIGENWGDEIVTKFGDTLGDDFVTYCFTQYGDFLGELPEMVRIKVTKMSPNLVTNLVTILSLFISPIMVIFGGICRNWW